MGKTTAVSAAVATLSKGADKPAKPATEAPVTFDRAAVTAQATALASADAAYDNAMAAVGQAVARILGTKPTHAHWEGVAEAFQADYAKARGCAEKTAANRWHMVTAYLRDTFALEKPAKPSKDAARVAKARAATEAAKAKIIKAHKGDVAAIFEAAKKAAPHEAAVYAKAAEEAASAAQKAALKSAKDHESKLRAEAGKILQAASGALLDRLVTQMRQIVAESRAKV